MKAKDKKYIRDKELIHRHPQLQYRMRAILLDWIIEVSTPPPPAPLHPYTIAPPRVGHRQSWV